MKTWFRIVSVLAVGTGAVMAAAPRAEKPDGPSVEELTRRARASNLEGRELVTETIRLTAQAYTHYSAWHLWERSRASLRHRRGWSHQYNSILSTVLRQLGFETRMVHTAWVLGADHPWWHNGHTWVKVNVDGRWLDACASRADNQAGELPVTPDSDELTFGRRTRIAITLSLAPFVVAEVWRAWLTRRPIPSWIYRERS